MTIKKVVRYFEELPPPLPTPEERVDFSQCPLALYYKKAARSLRRQMAHEKNQQRVGL